MSRRRAPKTSGRKFSPRWGSTRRTTPPNKRAAQCKRAALSSRPFLLSGNRASETEFAGTDLAIEMLVDRHILLLHGAVEIDRLGNRGRIEPFLHEFHLAVLERAR